MAFDINSVGGWGEGITDLTATNETAVNVYAKVTSLSGNQITLEDATNFNVGDEILFQIAAGIGSNATRGNTGRWCIATITAKNDSTLTVTKNVQSLFVYPSTTPSDYRCQVVKIPHYKNFTIPSGVTISPPAFDGYVGGILVFKCSDTLAVNGHIDLVDKGYSGTGLYHDTIPRGSLDTDDYAGWENGLCTQAFPVNKGDGAVMIFAYKVQIANTARIGNTDSNIQPVNFCRGASDSLNKPTNVTNIGGANIMVVAYDLNSVMRLVKYRDATKSAGSGIARCYVASHKRFQNDEGLYSYEVLSEPDRLASYCNTGSHFGDGSDGAKTNPATNFNAYACVSSISGKVVNYNSKSKTGSWAGKLVMIHWTQLSDTTTTYAGRFWLAKCLADDNYKLTLDTKPPDISTAAYSCQAILIPQFDSFTLSTTYKGTPAFSNGKGGICAFAVKGTCDLRGGVINVERCGGSIAPVKFTGSPVTYGNNQNSFHLPIGQGHGSVFILAKKIIMNANTRIGATYSGATLTGYRGADGTNATGGSPAGAGISPSGDTSGYFSNASKTSAQGYGYQGAHIFIVADTIEGFHIAAISTGGQAGDSDIQSGGAGDGGEGAYTVENSIVGGKGGYIAGGGHAGFTNDNGGGGAGTAFVYCNNAKYQETKGISSPA